MAVRALSAQRSRYNQKNYYKTLIMKIKAVIWEENGVWCGSVPAIPGCHTWGESYEHLLNVRRCYSRLA